MTRGIITPKHVVQGRCSSLSAFVRCLLVYLGARAALTPYLKLNTEQLETFPKEITRMW